MFNIEKIYEKEIPFAGSGWTSELAKRFILKNDNGKIIEASYFIRFDDKHKPVSVAFEPSLFYGCPIKCIFCASGSIKDVSVLKPQEVFGIVELLIEDYKRFFKDIQKVPVYIGYSGIGEGTLLGKNLTAISKKIHDQYPFVIFKIATMGANMKAVLDFAESKLPLRSIQLTLPHHDEKKLKYLFPGCKNYSLKKVLTVLRDFNSLYPKITIKINYLGIRNFNDSKECLDKTIVMIQKYLDDNFELKLSSLNITNISKKNSLVAMTRKELENFVKYCSKYKFRTYLWGSTEPDRLTCGELKEDYCD